MSKPRLNPDLLLADIRKAMDGVKVPDASAVISVLWGISATISLLYLVGWLTPLMVALSGTVMGTPVMWVIMSLPSLTLGFGLFWLARKLGGFKGITAIGLALAPFALHMAVLAPLSKHQVMQPAYSDGGSLPQFVPTDILAVIDQTRRSARNGGVCGPTCVRILQATSIEAIFLPRTYFDDYGDASGVIYRMAHPGQDCSVRVSMARRHPVCLSATPARMTQASHVLSLHNIPGKAQSPDGIGLHGGRQITLVGASHTKPLYQETGVTGRAFSWAAVIGDPFLNTPHPRVRTRFLTTKMTVPLRNVSLMEWLAQEIIYQPRGQLPRER